MPPHPLFSQSGSVPRRLASIDHVTGLGLASGRLPERGHSAFSPSTPQLCLRGHSLAVMALFFSLQLPKTQLLWGSGQLLPPFSTSGCGTLGTGCYCWALCTLSLPDSSRSHSNPLQPFDCAVFLLGLRTT